MPARTGIRIAMKKFFMLLIRLYQIAISPLLGNRCRFQPTCSAYAMEAFDKYPPHKAFWLSFKRISKCHPFHPGGYDPLMTRD